MDIWYVALIVLHVVIALAIIGLVLLQHGKGADMGSGFGGGASASLFGATGSANFLSRMTAVLATIFFLLSLGLAYLATNRPKASIGGGILDAVKTEKPAGEVPQPPVPASPTSAPAPAPQKPAAEAAKPAAEPAKPASGEPAKAKDVPN